MESKPGHVNTFDLICGTGFGGVIALLLGRLGMVGYLVSEFPYSKSC